PLRSGPGKSGPPLSAPDRPGSQRADSVEKPPQIAVPDRPDPLLRSGGGPLPALPLRGLARRLLSIQAAHGNVSAAGSIAPLPANTHTCTPGDAAADGIPPRSTATSNSASGRRTWESPRVRGQEAVRGKQTAL